MSDRIMLQLDGLVLRPPRPSDAAALLEAILESIDHLRPWLPWARHDYNASDAQLWISGELGDVHRFVMIDPDGRLVGSCALNTVDTVNHRANLGYWVHVDHTGHGYATRATVALASLGLRQAGLQRIEVVMSVHNEASRHVAERAGATYEGIARRRLLLHDVEHDAFIYSFISADLEA